MILLDLFLTFFRIGAFTFGGGYAMLPLVQQEVEHHGWMSKEQLVNFIAVSESTPGPFAVNVSTYVGAVTGGLPGAFAATLGVVLPSFLIILIIAKFYERFRKATAVESAMRGLRPAVVGLIGASVWSIGREVFFRERIEQADFAAPQLYLSLGIFALAIYLSFGRHLHPVKIILISAACGIAAGAAGLL